MTDLGGVLFVATKKNRLLKLLPDRQGSGWTDIGHANDVIVMASARGCLFAVDKAWKLWMRKPDAIGIHWTHVFKEEKVVMIAPASDKLWVLTAQQHLELWEPPAS